MAFMRTPVRVKRMKADHIDRNPPSYQFLGKIGVVPARGDGLWMEEGGNNEQLFSHRLIAFGSGSEKLRLSVNANLSIHGSKKSQKRHAGLDPVFETYL